MTETQRRNTYGYLYGERILLRPPTIQDASRVFNWERDEVVWRYDPHRPFSQNMAEFLPIFERNYVRGNGRQFWYIIEDEYQAPIGTITYFNVDYRVGQAEMGLGLGEKSRWGRGYGPEAIRTLTAHLFTVPGMARLYAETAQANQPARRAFVKAGFVEVGPIYDPRSAGEPWVLLEIRKHFNNRTK
jgi:RimJ/RimL family protein N-acetyltransferase